MTPDERHTCIYIDNVIKRELFAPGILLKDHVVVAGLGATLK